MDARVGKIEDKIGKIGEDQSAIKENLTMMGKTLGTLADVRAETLHLMKQQESDKKDHDEIFSRLRTAETTQAAYKSDKKDHDEIFKRLRDVENGRTRSDEKHRVTKDAVAKLETNQRWGVIVVLGTIISYAIKKIFW